MYPRLSISLEMFLHLAICGLLLSSRSIATNTLSHSRALTGNETLVSGNGKFALGFFQTSRKSSNDTLNKYLGIWFDKVHKLTPVWTANRHNPISGAVSPELMITHDGNLAIFAKGTIIWSTQAKITTNDTAVVLLDNGNLVIRSSSNFSHFFWQSFDHPTDTILPGLKIGWNKVTGLNRHLVSRKNLIDQAPGLYSAELGRLDGIGRLLWNSSVEYFSTGQWNGRFFSLEPEMSGSSVANYTFVNNDQEVYFSYTLLDDNMIVHDVLDVSGQKKMRIWTGQDWITINNIPKGPCDVPAVCGPFTVCTAYANPLCTCMKGFSIKSPDDWRLEDRRGGCIRNTPLNCGGNDTNKIGMSRMTDRFYYMRNIRLPQNAKGIQNASSMNGCAQICLSNCSCTAYSYQKGVCSIWLDKLLNVAADANGEYIYLRLAAKEVQNWKRNISGMIIGVVIGASIASLALMLLMLSCRIKLKWFSRTIDNNQGVGIIAFKHADLRRATLNFSEKLGGGGFGSVFKGSLSDSVAIAVKRLDGTRQGEKQFKAEVNSIGIIQHRNLVKLVGFCCEGASRLLVYEHMVNGSLDAHLFHQSHGIVLDWTIRYQIALGVARGLAYLHHTCRECIIHCDIKPQNILLDGSFLPKIADFGMAKFLGRDFSRVVTTMRGTLGYLAPEWISGTAITSKVDVYSYGMVLLEIISGQRNSGKECPSTDGDHEGYVPVQVVDKLLDGDIESIVDANLYGNVNLGEVERVCKVACWCIQDDEFDRPTMVEVVQFLEGLFEPEMPPMPRLLHAIAGGSHSTTGP